MSLLDKIGQKAGLWMLARWFRRAAEGEMGASVQRFYWWAAGKKRITGFVLAFVAAGLEGTGRHGAALFLGSVAAILVQVGLLDAAWRATPPKSPEGK